jgi:hypothetical protein
MERCHAERPFPPSRRGPGRRAGPVSRLDLRAAPAAPGRPAPIGGDPHPHAYRRAVDDRLGASTSPAEFRRRAQFVDYERARAAAEEWNARSGRDGGALLVRTAHPAWRGAVQRPHGDDRDDGDGDGPGGPDVNGGYYGARKGCEPVHVQADHTDGAVLVANHTAAALRGTLAGAQLYDLGGRPIGPLVTRHLDIPAGGTAGAFTVPFDRSLPATHLLRLRLSDARGRLLSANDYWRYRTPTDMRSLNGLPSVRLSLRTRATGRNGVTATVGNTGTSPAAMVRLALRDPYPGQRVLPVLADDNYFWLLPGESREVTLSWPAGARGPAGTPSVEAEAYNAVRVTVS